MKFFFSLPMTTNVEAAGGGVALSIAESVRYQRGAHVEEVTRVEVVCHGNKSGIVRPRKEHPRRPVPPVMPTSTRIVMSSGAVGDDWPRYINSHYQRWNRKKRTFLLQGKKIHNWLECIILFVCLYVFFFGGGGGVGGGWGKEVLHFW